LFDLHHFVNNAIFSIEKEEKTQETLCIFAYSFLSNFAFLYEIQEKSRVF